MSYVYLLAGEDLELAEADLEGFLRSQGLEEKPESEGRLVITEVEPMKPQLRRLARTHEVSELISRSDSLETDYRPEGSFAVRAEDLESGNETKQVERKLGEVMETGDNSVDLDNPEEVIRVYIKEEEYVIARLVENIDRSLFEKRKNQERPFSSPVSLDPELARLLVNLSGVKPGERLLDPFCGTGGILIEAGLCGVDVYGADVQSEMVEGTGENLEEYGIVRHDIREARVEDVEDELEGSFDAVVTDLPYGKASKSEGEPVQEFVERVKNLSETAVFMSNEKAIKGLEPEFEIYVHKNLTRYIYRL